MAHNDSRARQTIRFGGPPTPLVGALHVNIEKHVDKAGQDALALPQPS